MDNEREEDGQSRKFLSLMRFVLPSFSFSVSVYHCLYQETACRCDTKCLSRDSKHVMINVRETGNEITSSLYEN